jgi:hypothetical protein
MPRSVNLRQAWLFVLLFVALSACATAPVQEMSDARQAVEAAAAVDAAAKAPQAYLKARAHIKRAEAALQSGAYSKAREHATWAKTYAVDARRRALARQAR